MALLMIRGLQAHLPSYLLARTSTSATTRPAQYFLLTFFSCNNNITSSGSVVGGVEQRSSLYRHQGAAAGQEVVRVHVRHMSIQKNTTTSRGENYYHHDDDDNDHPHHSNKSWNERFNEFLAYKEANGGDVLIPQNYPPNPQLGKWVSHMRGHYKKFHEQQSSSSLDEEKIRLLDKEGFIWHVHEDSWNQRFQEFKQYKVEYDHVFVPQDYPPNPQLGNWVSNMRQEYKNSQTCSKKKQKSSSSLNDHRIRLLEEEGFIWDPHEDQWNQRFQELKEYKESHGAGTTSTLPPRNMEEYKELATWVDNQRHHYAKRVKGEHSFMTDKRMAMLDDIGFIWDPLEEAWNIRFEELKGYICNHGHCLVSQKNHHSNKKLGMWVNEQRKEYRKLQLSPERRGKLESVGFVWNVFEYNWNKKCDELKHFVTVNGHCNIPTKNGDNKSLRTWVGKQKREYQKFINGEKSILDETRVERLREAGLTLS